jgi:hypothetical protein
VPRRRDRKPSQTSRRPMLRRSCQNDQSLSANFQKRRSDSPRLCHTQQDEAGLVCIDASRQGSALCTGARSEELRMDDGRKRRAQVRAAAIGRFILGLIKINIDEKSGTGRDGPVLRPL